MIPVYYKKMSPSTRGQALVTYNTKYKRYSVFLRSRRYQTVILISNNKQTILAV